MRTSERRAFDTRTTAKWPKHPSVGHRPSVVIPKTLAGVGSQTSGVVAMRNEITPKCHDKWGHPTPTSPQPATEELQNPVVGCVMARKGFSNTNITSGYSISILSLFRRTSPSRKGVTGSTDEKAEPDLDTPPRYRVGFHELTRTTFASRRRAEWSEWCHRLGYRTPHQISAVWYVAEICQVEHGSAS